MASSSNLRDEPSDGSTLSGVVLEEIDGGRTLCCSRYTHTTDEIWPGRRSASTGIDAMLDIKEPQIAALDIAEPNPIEQGNATPT
ncbi:MAG: hypothetical protein AAGF15_12240 [Pseudomonadota bacterium]